MSIESIITTVANASSEEVKKRAKQEIEEEEDNRAKRLDNDIKEQDKEERRLYAYRVFTLICFWLLCVVLILIA